jgi:hypothetical protein
MPRLLTSDLPADVVLAADGAQDGLRAEAHPDGSIAKVSGWRHGVLVGTVVVTADAASLQTPEHFVPCDDGADDDDPDGFKAWVGSALEELSRRAAGTVACAFCGKGSTEVAKIIMGPHQGICNECVKVCAEIVAED